MSGGGPPHHPHNRHVPSANSAWNHLPVPSYFPRQPQVAHMQAEHSLLHQATWHTPTTEAMKMIPHTQMLNEMFKNEALFPRDCVDLSLTRNGSQNGEHPSAPTAISLSVRDTSKINSLASGMLDIQAMELTKCASPNFKSAVSPGSIRTSSMSPGLKAASPGLLSSGPAIKSLSPGRKSLSPGPKSSSPGLSLGSAAVLSTVSSTVSAPDLGKNQKRSNIRVDSILERLNPIQEKTFPYQDIKHDQPSATTTTTSIPLTTDKSQPEKLLLQSQSVIVQAASNYDENSNSSGTTNVPTPKEEDSASMNSNEDSLDSTKSRRKRKPSKTIRVNKEDEIKTEKDQTSTETSSSSDLQVFNHKDEPTDLTPQSSDPVAIATILEGTTSKLPERPDSATDELDGVVPAKTRRKTSSESETIDDIAAMVQEGLKEKERKTVVDRGGEDDRKAEDIVKPVQSPKTEVSNHETDLMPEQSKDEEVKSELDVMSVPKDTVDGVDRKDEPSEKVPSPSPVTVTKPVTVSVIKSKEILEETLVSDNDVPPEVSSTIESTPSPALPSVPPLITPAQKKASITHFVEVENKLEEMFAGIVEEGPIETTSTNVALGEPLKNDSTFGLTDDSLLKLDDSVTSTKQEDSLKEEEKSVQEPQTTPNQDSIKEEEQDEKKQSPKKMRRIRPPSKRESDQEGEIPAKKKKLIKTKGTPSKKQPRSPVGVTSKSPKKVSVPFTASKAPTKVASSDVSKELFSYDSGSNASSSKSRGPFVQIRGPRDSPVSVSVVNTPFAGDEDGEKKSVKNKKFHDDSEYRHKVRSKGLHCSTLSNKYDAERKDASWICAFCKRGPHASELTGPSVVSDVPPPGDLFGPYFITAQCPEFEKRLDDPYDRQFKSRKIGKVLDSGSSSTSLTKPNKKTKRKSESSVDPADIYLGITDTGNNTYEVWMHEDCMVWSPGVYLVGPKIAGLEEAVWTCSNMPCTGCSLKGANVMCVKRGCLNSTHLCCARKTHWQLDEVNFKAFCPEHSR